MKYPADNVVNWFRNSYSIFVEAKGFLPSVLIVDPGTEIVDGDELRLLHDEIDRWKLLVMAIVRQNGDTLSLGQIHLESIAKGDRVELLADLQNRSTVFRFVPCYGKSLDTFPTASVE